MKTSLYCTLLLLLTGCAAVRFKTNTDSRPRFSRILVVSRLPKARANYLDTWLTSFPGQYEVCVVDVSELTFGNPDSLISRKARACKSDVLLTVDLNRNFTRGSGRYVASRTEFSLQMVSLPDRSPFWKALATETKQANSIRPKRVVRQLVTDKIIEGPVPPATL